MSLKNGIIPALAGNTDGPATPRPRTGDHPRACGEHRAARRIAGRVVGSSPRLRGTRHRSAHSADYIGIIPALAGNTPADRGQRQKSRDHPRACGEHRVDGEQQSCHLGSSPRLRGTPIPPPRRRRPSGIIPALAGNTSRPAPPKSPPRDHPRACGEHTGKKWTRGGTPGSSPRLRGTPAQTLVDDRQTRIIPALAGNTSRPIERC